MATIRARQLEKIIKKQEEYVKKCLQDPRTQYLKKQGYTHTQLVRKFRYEYNNPNWRTQKENNNWIAQNKMVEAETKTGCKPTR